jgi:acetyl esterase/lipase
VFLHGGGFRAGEPGSFGYHGRPYLASGVIFASMGYRLVPDARFPESCDDVEAGLEWLWSNVADRGGDPDRIYLSGHSAGAMLAASVGLRPRNQAIPDLVKGLVLISGMYDFTNQSSDIVDRDSPRYVASLTEAIERAPDHTVVVAGEKDFPPAISGAHAMHEALQSRGASAELFIEEGADHFRANQSFVVEGGAVFTSTRQMMKL